jgi:excisionase family DNA binding protein
MQNPFQEIIDRLQHIEGMLAKLQRQQPEKEPTEDFLTVDQAAHLLKISVPSVYRLTMNRKIPFRKLHKRLYFSRKELTEFINANHKPVRV